MRKPIEEIDFPTHEPFKYSLDPQEVAVKINELINTVNELSEEVRSLKNQTNRV